MKIALSDSIFQMANSNYHILLGSLIFHKNELKLNDWLYYLLIHQSPDAIFKEDKRSDNFKTLFRWFLLSKSGYKVQLNYTDTEIMLSVFSLEKVFGLPVNKLPNEDGWFVNINAYHIKDFNERLVTNSSNYNLKIPVNPFLLS